MKTRMLTLAAAAAMVFTGCAPSAPAASAPAQSPAASVRPAVSEQQPNQPEIPAVLQNKGPDEFLTVTAISERTGLAYQTVYRYIQHMISQDRVEVSQSYGKVGRPKQQYRLKGL